MTEHLRLVLDAMCLNHFARIDRMDVLGFVLVDHDCSTTDFVRIELHRGCAAHPELLRALEANWLDVHQLDTVDALLAFEKWTRRIGAGDRDVGEASVFAAAELIGGIAITDDRAAGRVAKRYGLEVHGTLWLLADACRRGKLGTGETSTLIDMLLESGMRLPCKGSEFPTWARTHGLL